MGTGELANCELAEQCLSPFLAFICVHVCVSECICAWESKWVWENKLFICVSQNVLCADVETSLILLTEVCCFNVSLVSYTL